MPHPSEPLIAALAPPRAIPRLRDLAALSLADLAVLMLRAAAILVLLSPLGLIALLALA